MSEKSVEHQPFLDPSNSEKKLLKLFFIVLVLLIFILIGEGVYYFKIQKEKESFKKISSKRGPLLNISEVNEEPALNVSRLNNLEIAEKVLAWLDKQRNENGVYLYGWRCQASGSCQSIPDNRVGLYALWGRFKHYQATQDQKDLNIIDRDLGIYSDETKVNVIQNDFWNCKLMYEMWKSNLFSEEQKKKIEAICQRGNYNPLDLSEVDAKIASGEVEKIDLGEIASGEVAGMSSLSTQDGKLIEYSAFASDFAAKYLWKNKEEELKRAKGYLKKAIDLYIGETTEGKYFSKGARCVFGIAGLDLYQATQEKKYLDFSTRFFNEVGVGESHNLSLFSRIICALFAQQLYQITQEDQYRQTKINLVNSLIEEAFDYEGYKGYFFGGGYFRSINSTEINKFVKENGLIVGILSE